MNSRIFVSIFVIVIVSACTANRSSLEEGLSESSIYELDESLAFNLAYSAIQEVFPQEKISVLTAPSRGYITKFLAPPLHVDWFTQKVLIHRSSGVNESGETVKGYWIQVTGSGSSFLQGQLKNKKVFNKIVQYFEQSAIKHRVSEISSAPYSLSQENFYIRGADVLDGKGTRIVLTGTKSDDSDTLRLRELHKLKNDGIISEEEFEIAKNKILSRIE